MASRVLGALAVAATAAIASLVLATPASAHTIDGWAKCVEKEGKKVPYLYVNLTAYNGKKPNSYVLKDNGVEVEAKEFRKSEEIKYTAKDATVKHTFTIDVKTHDGYDAERKYEIKDPCVQAPPTKTTKPEPTQPPVTSSPAPEVPSSSASPSSSTPAAPAPGGSTPEPPLAATGASPLWLLLSGVGLVGAGAATVLFVRRRRA